MNEGRRLVADLEAVVGDAHVLTDPQLRAGFESDWTGRFGGTSLAVVRPSNTREVAGVVTACYEHGISLVPQGGNTGLVGGGVPTDGEVVLSTRRLTHTGEPDRATSQITVGAGLTLGSLQDRLSLEGMQFGLDLASRDSATLGGMASTNAGGTRVLRKGTMRAQVLGLEAVLGDGSVVTQLRGLTKDTSGYELAGLLVGSEGTLGVITALRLAIDRAPLQRAVAIVGTSSIDDAVLVATGVRDRLPTLRSAELLDARTLDLVVSERDLARPMGARARWYLLVECAGATDQASDLAAALEKSERRIEDAVVAEEGPRIETLWRYRELATEVLAAAGPPRKLDVSVPVDSLQTFADEVFRAVSRVAGDAKVHLFGHLLDGNIHCNILDVGEDVAGDVDEVVLSLAVRLGGSIGAEHGIGRAKLGFMHLVRSPAELDAFRSIKKALDPRGILNPGVLLPDVEGS
ncbi:MAG TPA: FAD-binding oxidoreductase [Acidimicrobiales bacterium]|nr:FAD-binding oxidoreductase [Acidimicrobiales bacterium]